MTVIKQTISRIVFPFMLLFSIYVITHGHLTPGGGFQGGVLLASSVILICLVYGLRKAEHLIREETSHRIEAVAGILLAVLVVFEFFIKGSLMASESLFQVWSGGAIPVMNVIGGIMVATSFIIIFYSMVKEK